MALTSEPPGARSDSEREWLQVREYLLEHRSALGVEAAHLYPDVPRVGGTPLLTTPAWVPPRPIPLERISLHLDPTTLSANSTSLSSAPSIPIRPDGTPYRSYADAVAHLSAPAVFENRRTYRLQAADLASAEPTLRFGTGRFFDSLDTGAAHAHAYAAARRNSSESNAELARLDPIDLTARTANVAITALTLVHNRATGEARFLLHWRDPDKVAHAGGLLQAVPAGVFQPATDAAESIENDFSLWRCLVREFSEELLGEPEPDPSGEPVDYERWPFAADLTRELRAGGIRAFCVGLGVDPLTFATDLLCAVVIDAIVFDRHFADLVTVNAEGELVRSDDGGIGLPFVETEVERLTGAAPMQAAGAATLRSAWAHRAELLATPPKPSSHRSQTPANRRHQRPSGERRADRS